MTVTDPTVARRDFLLPGLAVYASESNLNKYKDILIPEENIIYSSQKIREACERYTILFNKSLN